MEQYIGDIIFQGIAIGHIHFLKQDNYGVSKHSITDCKAEISRFEVAKEKSIEQLYKIYEKVVNDVSKEEAAIIEAQIVLINDEEFNHCIRNKICTSMVNAEYATKSAEQYYTNKISKIQDEYIKAKIIDIIDISDRIINNLLEKNVAMNLGDTPVIIIAYELKPSHMIQLRRKKILGIISELGSVNSHTSIIAKSMNIPVILGIKVNSLWDGKYAIVDGHKGICIIEPNQEVLEKYRQELVKINADKLSLHGLIGKEDVTLSGIRINLYSNTGSLEEVEMSIQNDAKGIGLFRTEFIYLGQDYYPTEEEQILIYETVLRRMGDKKVVFRTLDIGGDKQTPYFDIFPEDNPAMGYRGIRVCLDRKDVFKTQLRALLRASIYGNMSIMYPMIISLEEIRSIKAIVEEVKSELDKEQIPYRNVQQGIMIETPAAAMISDLLAKEVDFFSIGTNDLTQYTLAMDRQNAKLDQLYDTHHPAILKLIRLTIENAHKHNCFVGICGELAADITLTNTFIEYGVDELSVTPSALLKVKRAILESDC